jgi:hypothetical protein
MSQEETARPPETALSVGSSRGRILLRIVNDRLFIDIIGEPTGPDLIDCFRRALATGQLKPSMRTMVDLTQFSGTVDWHSIDTIARMAPWGRGRPGAARVAYVVRNQPFFLLIKAAWARFPLVQYRIFFSRQEALVWLEAPS